MNYALKRLWIGHILLGLFVVFYTIPKTSDMVIKLWEGYNNGRAEVKYLRWVNSELPMNAIILGGGKSDLVTVAQNLNRPIIYNSLWSQALLIKPKEIPGVKPTDFEIINQLKHTYNLKVTEIVGISPTDFSIVAELKNKDNFRKNKYIILEDDINLWRGRLAGIGDNLFGTSSAALLSPADYSIKVYKFNSTSNKSIYELTFTHK